MASSSSSSPGQVKHQVFLSFRGQDTRQGFTSHLLEAFREKGVNVFFDEKTIEKREELSQALLSAVAKSQLAIIILVEDYASSKSCLMELSEIMGTEGQIVLPIFYHVNPSDVRRHGWSFKKSFDEHQPKRPVKEVQLWKAAFAKIGGLKGWHVEGGYFDRFVFKQLNPAADFRDLSEKFVDYAGGLPLALKVSGASLFGKPRQVWESALDRLKEIPNPSILRELRISFDELDEVYKDIFFDIAWFFRWGKQRYYSNRITKLL